MVRYKLKFSILKILLKERFSQLHAVKLEQRLVRYWRSGQQPTRPAVFVGNETQRINFLKNCIHVRAACCSWSASRWRHLELLYEQVASSVRRFPTSGSGRSKGSPDSSEVLSHDEFNSHFCFQFVCFLFSPVFIYNVKMLWTKRS